MRKKNNNIPAGKSAFTLIELLVVISIIALLMAILIPALGKVRGHAKRTICASRLRQISTALSSYAAEHNDRIVSAKGFMDESTDGQLFWAFAIMPYISRSFNMADFYQQMQNGPGGSYPEMNGNLILDPLFICPADKDPSPKGLGAFSTMYPNCAVTSYGLNGFVGKDTDGNTVRLGPAAGIKFSQVPTPSACMMMGETCYSGQFVEMDSQAAANIRNNLKGADKERFEWAHYRLNGGFYHDDTMNILYVDGHVDSIAGREAEKVETPCSLVEDNGMFWPQLRLPNVSESKAFWGPGY